MVPGWCCASKICPTKYSGNTTAYSSFTALNTAWRASKRSVPMGPAGWYGTASWDNAHYYMGIQNSRTHWAEPTAQRVRFV